MLKALTLISGKGRGWINTKAVNTVLEVLISTVPFLKKKTQRKKKKPDIIHTWCGFLCRKPKGTRDSQTHKIAEHMCWIENQYGKINLTKEP